MLTINNRTMQVQHIEKWAHRATVDYYIMFVKAWIPFNAWYKRECQQAGLSNLSDSSCISYICMNTNTFKTKILALLDGSDISALHFKFSIAKLHEALKSHVIPDMNHPINFSTMVPGITSTNLVDRNYRNLHYKVERLGTNSFSYDIVVEDLPTHATKYTKHLTKWKWNDIENDANYLHLSNACKGKIKEYFQEVNPNKPLDIVRQGKTLPNGTFQKPANSIEIGTDTGVFFTNNKDDIAKVLIHLLYKLRCEIFHGSLDPTEANEVIYEHAYNILFPLVKELY